MNLASRLIVLVTFICPMMNALSQTTNRTGAIVVVSPSRLPEEAQMAADSMFLRFGGDGTYLYIEQHAQNRILVLDVTHPNHIQRVATVVMQGPAFDFVRPLGTSSALVCFRDNSGSGIVQFRKSKNPTIIAAPGLRQAAHAQDIGSFGLLLTNEARVPNDVPQHDVQVIDLSSPDRPVVLANVLSVHQELTDSDSGAHFLLGSGGLTVIRQPDVEQQYELSMRTSN